MPISLTTQALKALDGGRGSTFLQLYSLNPLSTATHVFYLEKEGVFETNFLTAPTFAWWSSLAMHIPSAFQKKQITGWVLGIDPPAQRTILTWSKISWNEYNENLRCPSSAASLCSGVLFHNIDMVLGHLDHLGNKLPHKGLSFCSQMVLATMQETRKKCVMDHYLWTWENISAKVTCLLLIWVTKFRLQNRPPD